MAINVKGKGKKFTLTGETYPGAYTVLIHNEQAVGEQAIGDDGLYSFQLDELKPGHHKIDLYVFDPRIGTDEIYDEPLEIVTLVDEEIKAPVVEVAKNSTGAFAKRLRDMGFTVNREKDKTFSIMVDRMTIDLPTEMEGKASEWYYTTVVALANHKGYSELSKRAMLGRGAKRLKMTLSSFTAVVPKIMSGQKFLPAEFEQAYQDGNLYRLKGALPGSLRVLFDGLEVPTISLNDLSTDLFLAKRNPDDTWTKGEWADRVWLCAYNEDVQVLCDNGCPPPNIWTVDRLVRDTYLTAPDYSIEEMHAMLPGSEFEGGVLKIKIGYTSNVFEVSYVADPHLMPNDPEDQRVWKVNDKIFLKHHYVPDFGIVSDAKAVWCMINYLIHSTSMDKVEGKLAYTSNLFQQAFYEYALGDNRIRTAAKFAQGCWQIKSNNQELTPVLKNEDSPNSIAEGVAAFLTRDLGTEEYEIEHNGELVKGIRPKQPDPAIADAQIGKGYVADGARMKGFATAWDEDLKQWLLVNANDNSKEGKYTNRASLVASWQARVLSKGTKTFYFNESDTEALMFGDEKRDLMVESGFRLIGSRGVGIADMGIKCRVWMTNWVFANGSGVASSPRKSKFQLAVRKREDFTEVAIQADGRDPQEMIDELYKAEDLYKAVWPGDTLAWYNGRPICKFGTYEEHMGEAYGVVGSIVEIDPPKAVNIQRNMYGEVITFDLAGSISVLMTYNESVPKFRKIGNKYTIIGEDVYVYNTDGTGVPMYLMPDIIVDTENAKQDEHMISVMALWADSTEGGVDYDVSKGLTPKQQEEFAEFRKNNTSLKWLWTEPLPDVHFRAFCEEYGTRTDFAFDLETHQVGQLCTVVEGDLVLSVEVSTVRENVGTQAIIPEQLAALACIYRPLALDLWNNNSEVHNAVLSMLEMGIKNSKPCGAHWIKGQRGNPEIPGLVEKDGIVDVRKTFQMLHQVFPDGLTVEAPHYDREVLVNLRFDALDKFSIASDSVGNSVIKLIQHLSVHEMDRAKGWDNLVGRLVAMTSGAVEKWAVSAGNTKSLGRTDKVLHGRKIKPLGRRWVQPGKIYLNPADPIVLMAKKHEQKQEKDKEILLSKYLAGEIDEETYRAAMRYLAEIRKGVKAGDHLAVSRSPMISVFMGEVVEDDRAPIGVYTVSDWDWHRGNEGDGDGDPSAGLRIPPHYVREVRDNLMDSVFGPCGYYVAWGSTNFRELPIMDFYRGHEKKSLGYFPGSTDSWEQLMHREHSPMGRARTIQEVDEILRNIGEHYTRFVGKAFAMGSALVFKLEFMDTIAGYIQSGVLSEEATEAAYKLLEPGYGTACAKIWRRVYEGLALSGISGKALAFAADIRHIGQVNQIIISQAKGDDEFDKIRQGTGVNFESFPDKDDPDVEIAILPEHLAALVAFWKADIVLDEDEAKAIHWAILVTALYSKIEGRATDIDWDTFVSELAEHFQDERLLEDACVYGSLRRAGAGRHKRPDARNSMISRIEELDIESEGNYYSSFQPGVSIMGSIFDLAVRAQATAGEIRDGLWYY